MFALVSIACALYRGDAFCILYFVNINSAKRRVRDVIKMAYNRLTRGIWRHALPRENLSFYVT